MRARASHHLTWPACRFYWAILDTSGLPRSVFGHRPSPKPLGYAFESVLPGLQIEQVHAIYRQLPGNGRVLACGVPADALATVAEDVVVLTPETLPPFLTKPVDAASLNVLTGRFLPPALRRMRRRWTAHVLAILALCVAVVVWGLERRTNALRVQHDDVVAAGAAMVDQVLGPESRRSVGGLPPELQLEAEVRRLEQTRNARSEITRLKDCSASLEAVLVHWPADVRTQAEAISITEEAITVRCVVATMADAQSFAIAFATVPGWQLKQPRSETRRDHVVVTMRLEAGKVGRPP